MAGPSLLQALRVDNAPSGAQLPWETDLLAREESLPFFEASALEGESPGTWEMPSSKKGMAFVYYHKTGCEFSKAWQESLEMLAQ